QGVFPLHLRSNSKFTTRGSLKTKMAASSLHHPCQTCVSKTASVRLMGEFQTAKDPRQSRKYLLDPDNEDSMSCFSSATSFREGIVSLELINGVCGKRDSQLSETYLPRTHQSCS